MNHGDLDLGDFEIGFGAPSQKGYGGASQQLQAVSKFLSLLILYGYFGINYYTEL